jgi:hypothetical protein
MRFPVCCALALATLVPLSIGSAGLAADHQGDKSADQQAEKEALAEKLWPKSRIEAALRAVDTQRARGLLSEKAYQKRRQMLEARLAGGYDSLSLSVTNPPLNFIQNEGFEKINKNSARNRSRWLWWNGWSWGGDYENYWEDQPENVHSGQYSARIRCTGKTGRIGIFTPQLPAVPGATAYTLTFWAKGEGDNLLFVNFEGGVRGTVREKIAPEWKQYTVTGAPEQPNEPYGVYLYSIGGGTIWLDDMKLVPLGGSLDQ